MRTLVLATSTSVEAITQLGPLAVIGLLSAKRVNTLGREGRPVPGWRQASFYGGFVTMAGALMMVEESILTLGLFCWLFLVTAREVDERQDLLEFAAARDMPLSEERVMRAVGAGRGAERRARLEIQAESHATSLPAPALRATRVDDLVG